MNVMKHMENVAAELSSPSKDMMVRTIYILAFLPKPLPTKHGLDALAREAISKLRSTDDNFRFLLDSPLDSESEMQTEMAHVEFTPSLHTQETMRAAMDGWIERQHSTVFRPTLGVSFFPFTHLDEAGNESHFLFYFDFAVVS